MELPEDKKQALIEEIKAAMNGYRPDDEIDITATDIMDATGVRYNIALNFLNKLASMGVLKRIKLPTRAVVFRDVDGNALDKIKEHMASLIEP